MKPKRDPRNKGKKSSSAKKKDRDPGRKPDGDHTGPRSRVSRFPTAKKHLLCPIFEGHYEFSCALNALEISDGKFHVGDDSDRTHDAIKQELVTLLVFALDKVLTIDQDTHDCVQELVDRFYSKKLDDSPTEWIRFIANGMSEPTSFLEALTTLHSYEGDEPRRMLVLLPSPIVEHVRAIVHKFFASKPTDIEVNQALTTHSHLFDPTVTSEYRVYEKLHSHPEGRNMLSQLGINLFSEAMLQLGVSRPISAYLAQFGDPGDPVPVGADNPEFGNDPPGAAPQSEPPSNPDTESTTDRPQGAVEILPDRKA